MYYSRDEFINVITKSAAQTGDDEGQVVKGEQLEQTPELLQPDEGPGSGPRGEHESLSTGAEKEHMENREGGYLQNAFSGFNSAARQAGSDLRGALDDYGPNAIVSRATPEAGTSKLSSVQLEAFSDELGKIVGR